MEKNSRERIYELYGGVTGREEVKCDRVPHNAIYSSVFSTTNLLMVTNTSSSLWNNYLKEERKVKREKVEEEPKIKGTRGTRRTRETRGTRILMIPEILECFGEQIHPPRHLTLELEQPLLHLPCHRIVSPLFINHSYTLPVISPPPSFSPHIFLPLYSSFYSLFPHRSWLPPVLPSPEVQWVQNTNVWRSYYSY